MTFDEMKLRLAEIILERSFQYRDNPPFTLTSGRTSNYYFNCKTTTMDPEGMFLIGNILYEMLSDSGITAAGGLTLGADPIANALSLISYQKGRPIKSFVVRKDVKDHGTKKSIEGNIEAAEKVAILDDVITTGGSTITAIEIVRQASLKVDRVIALVDREEGGRENIRKYIDRVDSVLTRSEIMNLYKGHQENKK